MIFVEKSFRIFHIENSFTFNFKSAERQKNMQNEMAPVKQESDSSPNNIGNQEAGSRNACSPTDEFPDDEGYSALTFCQIFIKEEPYDVDKAGVLEDDYSTLQKEPAICHSINRTSDQSNETEVAELQIDGSSSIFPEEKCTEPNDGRKIEERFGNLYRCPHCSYTTRRSYNLRIHIRKHKGEKPYSCSYCIYKSTNMSNLKRHERLTHCTKMKTQPLRNIY